jgi:phage N-6-adenine-methyltransferase
MRGEAAPSGQTNAAPNENLDRNRGHAVSDIRSTAENKPSEATLDTTDEQLEAIAKNIETLVATAALQVGAELAKARDIFRYRRDEGGFAGWVETRLGYSRHTAYNLLHVHEQFGGQEVSKCLDTLGRSVLFLISAPSTPETARTEIIKRAEAGESISAAETKEVINEAKSRQQPAHRPVRGTGGTGENEWLTPAKYIEAARDVLGEIDLDPASNEQAQETVRAGTYFDKAQDGLRQQWHGQVWLNPPYAKLLIAQFVSKLRAERQAGRVTAAIMLTHNYTDTTWFQEAVAVADAICFPRGRVKFYQPNGKIAKPTQGQAFFYFGSDVTAFAQRFRSIGFVKVSEQVKATQTQPDRNEVGSASSCELERLQGRIHELEDKVRQRDTKIVGLESEIEELRADKQSDAAPLDPSDPGPIPAFLQRDLNRLSPEQLLDLLERRLSERGVDAYRQLQKIREWVAKAEPPTIDLTKEAETRH